MVPSHPSLPLSVPSLYFAPFNIFWGDGGDFMNQAIFWVMEVSKQIASMLAVSDFVILWESSPTGISQACLP